MTVGAAVIGKSHGNGPCGALTDISNESFGFLEESDPPHASTEGSLDSCGNRQKTLDGVHEETERSLLERFWRTLVEMEPTILFPLRLVRFPTQVCLSSGCAVACSALAVVLLTASSTMTEVVIGYSHGDTFKAFRIEEDMAGEVLLWYDLRNLNVNQKRFIQNKDQFIFASKIFAEYSCDGAETEADARRVRSGDETFSRYFDGHGGAAVRPCGLVTFSMFNDEYRLFNEAGEEVELEQADLALPADEQLYNGRILPVSDGPASGPFYTVEGVDSWLPGGPFLDHLKVWYRTPASPRVRHLWARIKGGLPAGLYRLHFSVNSPIWTSQWRVPEKQVILSQRHFFGSRGACQVLGAMCFAAGVTQVIMTLAIVFSSVWFL